MNIVFRYVLREILGPLTLGLIGFTFILLMDVLFDAAETIIRRDVSVWVVVRLMLLSLPHIVVLTIPMSLLYSIIIAVGRMNSDSELVALRASGISLFRLYRPVLFLSALLAVFTAWLMIEVLPWGNQREQELTRQIVASSLTRELPARVFHEDLLPDQVVYIFETPPDEDRWHGVFLSDALPKTQSKITVAASGQARISESGTQVVLTLADAIDQELDLLEPAELNISGHGRLTFRSEDELLGRRAQVSAERGLRELGLRELRHKARDPETPPTVRNRARVEIHKKFAISAACLVFGLFGVPLGFNNRRGGKSSGFAISIVVILVYYVMINNGEEAAAIGNTSPWLAMWAPNLMFTVIGTFLLARRNRDKSLLIGSVDRWVQTHLWGRVASLQRNRDLRRRERARQEPAREQRSQEGIPAGRTIVFRLPRPRLRFPNIIDRYVLRTFIRVFVMVLLSTMSIYVIADFTQRVDDILENQISSSVVIDYYKFQSLQIFYQVAPLVVLVTTLITFALLSHSNEITAAKALGFSLYRLTLPAVVAALVVAALAGLLGSSVLPYSNGRVAELRDQIRGQERVRTYRRADRQWLYGDGYIYNYQYYDPRRQALQRLQVFRFDEDHRLTGRLYAASARYDNGSWIIKEGWARSFDGAQVTSYTPLIESQRVDLPEEPEFFDTEIKQPEQMDYAELRDYVEMLIEGGQRVPELEVQLHNKIAMPVVSLVMALVALPFAFRLGKKGALYGIGLSLFLGIIFYAIIAFFTTLGEAGALPSQVAVWSPNVLFATLSLYLFLGLRT